MQDGLFQGWSWICRGGGKKAPVIPDPKEDPKSI